MTKTQAKILRELLGGAAAFEGYQGVQGTGTPGYCLLSRADTDAAGLLVEENMAHVMVHQKTASQYVVAHRDAAAWARKGWTALPIFAVRELAAQQGRDTKDKREARKAGA